MVDGVFIRGRRGFDVLVAFAAFVASAGVLLGMLRV
jgi:hypothetical protein